MIKNLLKDRENMMGALGAMIGFISIVISITVAPPGA